MGAARRQNAEDETGGGRERQREREHAPVERWRRRAGRDLLDEELQKAHAPEGHRETSGTAQRGQDDALGQDLTDDAAAGGPERGAHRDLLLSLMRSGEQQVGDVGAGDQQNERDGAEQNQQRRAARALDQLRQTAHADAPLRLERRIFLQQLPLDGVQLRVGALDRRLRLEPAEHDAPMRRPRGARRARRQDQRHEELVLAKHPRTARHDTHHGAGDIIEDDGSVDDRRVSAEARAPQLLGEDDDVVAATGTIVFFDESPSEQRTDAEHLQEIVAGGDPPQTFGRAAAAQVVRDAIENGDRVELGRMRLPVEIDAARDGVLVAVLEAFEDFDEPFGCGIRQRAEQHGVECAEDRGVGADAKRERQDGHGCEPGASAEQTKADHRVLLDVSGEIREPPAPLEAIVARCAADRAGPLAAELPRRSRAGIRLAQAVAHQVVGAHVEVKLEFVADVRAHVLAGAGGEGKQPLNATKSHASPSSDEYQVVSITLKIAAA